MSSPQPIPAVASTISSQELDSAAESSEKNRKGEDQTSAAVMNNRATQEAKPSAEQTEVVAQARRKVLVFLKFHDESLKSLLPTLLKRIEPVEAAASKVLLKRLSSMSNAGQAPSFADAGARSGYVRRRLHHRAAQVGIALMHPQLETVKSALEDEETANFNVASIGGGPGSDAVGLILLRNYLGASTKICTHVYDLEDGWAGTVDKLQDSMEAAGIACAGTTTTLEHCNVLLPLADEQNRGLATQARSYDLLLFSFVLAENRVGLIDSKLVFLRDLLSALKPSASILVLDCTFQIFQPVADVGEELGWDAHRVHWHKDINGHCKNVLLLQRKNPLEPHLQPNRQS